MFSVSPAIAWLIAGIAVLGAEIFLGTAYLLVVAFAFGATAAGAVLQFIRTHMQSDGSFSFRIPNPVLPLKM